MTRLDAARAADQPFPNLGFDTRRDGIEFNGIRVCARRLRTESRFAERHESHMVRGAMDRLCGSKTAAIWLPVSLRLSTRRTVGIGRGEFAQPARALERPASVAD